MQRLAKRIKVLAAIFVVFATFSYATAQAFAEDSVAAKKAVCEGLGGIDGGSGDCSDPSGSASVDSTVASVINILSMVVGVVAVIMIIVGGIKYVTSQGESAGVASAKNTIIYAVVGLIVVALAQLIVRFVVKRVTTNPTPPAGP